MAIQKTITSDFWSDVTNEMIGLGWLKEENGVNLEYVSLAVEEVRKRKGLKELTSKQAQYLAMNEWEKSLGGLVTRVNGKGRSYTLKATSQNTYDYVKCYERTPISESTEVKTPLNVAEEPRVRRHEKKTKHERMKKFATVRFVETTEEKNSQIKLNVGTLLENLKGLLNYSLKHGAVISLDRVKDLWEGAAIGWSGEDIIRNIHKPLNKLVGFQAVNFRYQINNDSNTVTLFGIEDCLEQIRTYENSKKAESNTEVVEKPIERKKEVFIKHNTDISLISQYNKLLLYTIARIIEQGKGSIGEIQKALEGETGVINFQDESPENIINLLNGFPEWFGVISDRVSLKNGVIFEKVNPSEEEMTTTVLLSSPIWEEDKKKIESLMASYSVVYRDEYYIVKLNHYADLKSLRLLGKLFSTVYPVTIIDGVKDLEERSKGIIERDFQATLNESF